MRAEQRMPPFRCSEAKRSGESCSVVHRDAAHAIEAQVLCYLEGERLAFMCGMKRIFNSWYAVCKTYVDDRTDDLSDSAFHIDVVRDNTKINALLQSRW